MVQAAFAFVFLVRRFDTVFIDCAPRLAPLYRAVGFHEIAGAETPEKSTLGFDLLAMHANERSLPARLRPAIEDMANEFVRVGHITHPDALLVSGPTRRQAASA